MGRHDDNRSNASPQNSSDSEPFYQSILHSVASFFVPTMNRVNDDDLMAGLDDDVDDNNDDDDGDNNNNNSSGKYGSHIDDDDDDKDDGDKKQEDMRHIHNNTSSPSAVAATMPISITPAAASTRYSLENEKDEMRTSSYSLPSSYDARFSTTATVDHEEDRRQREQDLKEMYIASQKQWNTDTKSVVYEDEEDSSSCDESVGEHGTDPIVAKNDREDSMAAVAAVQQQQRQRSVSDHNHDFGMRQRNDDPTDRSKKETDGHGLLDFWKTADFSIRKGQGNTAETAADALPEERHRSNSTGKLKDLWQRWFSSPSSSSPPPPACEQQQQQHGDDSGDQNQSFSSLKQREKEETRDFTDQIRKLNAQAISENNRRKEMAIALGDSEIENPKSEYLKMELITREIEEQVTRLEDVSTQQQQQQQQQRGYRSADD